MNFNCDELEQLAAIEALGALDGPDRARLQDILAGSPAARDAYRRFLDAAAALTVQVTPKKPGPSVRAKILQRIGTTPQVSASGSQSPAPAINPAAGIQFIFADAPWMESPLPGSRLKVLSAGPNQDYVMLLVEIGAGVTYPEHDHMGAEEMYVLTGDLQSEGRSLGPGDFLHAEPGTHHQPLHSIHGCTALMVVPKAAFAPLP
jgi:anti-sigma factor ChrR (cupin superfamily)